MMVTYSRGIARKEGNILAKETGYKNKSSLTQAVMSKCHWYWTLFRCQRQSLRSIMECLTTTLPFPFFNAMPTQDWPFYKPVSNLIYPQFPLLFRRPFRGGKPIIRAIKYDFADWWQNDMQKITHTQFWDKEDVIMPSILKNISWN